MMTMQRAKLQKEEKFKQSLKSWGDFDNRPFVRTKEHVLDDEKDYEMKAERIRKEKERIAKVTGDPLENIHLQDNWGNSEVYDFANRPLQ
ncbi:hypothetical protein vBBak6_017 [Bacillus phage v_B-Bak6]|nr:hypothetical protein vBBak1_017 [Bacillus phage v_B-Bak1]AXY83099.1 hypothetical protein vBBak6_017 [Bacillus phage v_B-Bak6]